MPIPDYRRQGAAETFDSPSRTLSGTPGSAGDDAVGDVLLFTGIVLVGKVAWSALLLVLGVSFEPLEWLGGAGIGLVVVKVLKPRAAEN